MSERRLNVTEAVDRAIRQHGQETYPHECCGALVGRDDGVTEVVVYKVGKLGAFDSKTVSLKPGTYVAVGTRQGYRDVRRSFHVAGNVPAPVVTLRCEEPI